jgi:hypothetical protein
MARFDVRVACKQPRCQAVVPDEATIYWSRDPINDRDRIFTVLVAVYWCETPCDLEPLYIDLFLRSCPAKTGKTSIAVTDQVVQLKSPNQGLIGNTDT